MKGNPLRIVKDMAETFTRKFVARSAAALSYYLTLSVFPFLICVSAILGSLQIYELGGFALLEDIMPSEAFSAITDYLVYLGGNRSELLFIVGLFAMLTTSSAAFRSFTSMMGDLQGKMRFKGIWKGIISFIISIAFLAAIYVSGLVILSGGWLMQILENVFGFSELLAFWTWFRFVILFLMLFAIIYGMYIISAPKETKKTHRLPGALAASVVLVAASIVYSRMISVSLRYTLLYGSLASFIILMIWLYTCALILIMGNVFNISLHKHYPRFDRRKELR